MEVNLVGITHKNQCHDMHSSKDLRTGVDTNENAYIFMLDFVYFSLSSSQCGRPQVTRQQSSFSSNASYMRD
jgi:hypothetical protein